MWQAGFLNLSYRARHLNWYTSKSKAQKLESASATGLHIRGQSSSKGLGVFSQEPPKDLFLNQSSSDSARAEIGAGAGRKVRLLRNSYELSAISSQETLIE